MIASQPLQSAQKYVYRGQLLTGDPELARYHSVIEARNGNTPPHRKAAVDNQDREHQRAEADPDEVGRSMNQFMCRRGESPFRQSTCQLRKKTAEARGGTYHVQA